jgi:CarD family transcriptional regulator
MTFQVGEKVVYPNHGVGTIENISTRSFGTNLERFYLLRFNYNSMTVMVPFSHVTEVGLRKITKAAEITRVLTYLAAGECKSSADWKIRFKVNSEKMRGGSLPEIAEVLKSLVIIGSDKPLSFREKKMLDRARHMLISEVSICRSVSEAGAVDLLQKALAKSNLTLPPAM